MSGFLLAPLCYCSDLKLTLERKMEIERQGKCRSALTFHLFWNSNLGSSKDLRSKGLPKGQNPTISAFKNNFLTAQNLVKDDHGMEFVFQKRCGTPSVGTSLLKPT